MTYLLLLLGFVLLVKGADFFVDGCSSIAKRLLIPSVIIGLTVVAFGTSLPEASVSITAAISGKNELALGNVIGSNLFNLLVVVGASAMIQPMPVRLSVLKKDFPFSILVTLILLLSFIPINGAPMTVGHIDGIIMLVLFIGYMIITVRQALSARKDGLEKIAIAEVQEEVAEYHVLSPWLTAIYIIGGSAAIVWGGDLVVDSASVIAANFGLSETLIGLTIVALGTSLPELVTSIVAARKGESDLALGNVVGSNIFNILLILGASSSIHPVGVTLFNVYDTAILLIASIIVFLFCLRKRDITRAEGFACLPIYAAFFIFILLR